MKKKFIGFYNPTKDEINEAWKKGIFAFDANTLLNLYRYTDKTRDDFLNALKTIKERLFLPYQAAFEYQNNRLEVIDSIENSYDELYEVFPENFDKYLKSQINKHKKHPSIVIEKIIKLHNDFLENLSNELNEQKLKHPDFRSKDDVLNELTDLFENSVGEEFSKEDLLKIYKEGESRYSNEIPPGYKDQINKKSKGQRHIYGDLIIWKELINNAKNKKYPLIFITDDRKEDWWTIQKGKTIRPREELIKEFFDFTGIRILIYNADHFLSFAKEKGLLPRLKLETIEEVKNIRVSDEKHYKSINDILSAQTFKPTTITDFLSTQRNFTDIVNNQAYNPVLVTDYLKVQKNITDIINKQAYTPLTISDYLNSHAKITDIINDQAYNPAYMTDYLNVQKNITDINGSQVQTSKGYSDIISNQTKKPLSPKRVEIKKKTNTNENEIDK